MNKIEKLIPIALEAAAKHLSKTNGKIPSEYNGYISSFGASVIQSGLLPAVVFNEKEKSESNKDRRKLMKAILHILNGSESEENEKLFELIIKKGNTQKTKRQIINAATALKLAIRTFELE